MADETFNVTAAKLLVIGYGNELRSDDGVGPKIAAAVEELNLKSVRTVSCQQLTPELAELISKVDRVVFVDAARDGSSSVDLRPIEPMETEPVMTHATDPQSLLALARQVFGHCPTAFWLTIPVVNIGFGDQLSGSAQEAIKIAVAKIRSLVENP